MLCRHSGLTILSDPPIHGLTWPRLATAPSMPWVSTQVKLTQVSSRNGQSPLLV